MNKHRRWLIWSLIIVVAIILYWQIPIKGSVIFLIGDKKSESWPRFDVQLPSKAGTAAEVMVSDIEPWPYVNLVVDDRVAMLQGTPMQSGSIYTWKWSFAVPSSPSYTLAFYINCHTGCEERGKIIYGVPLITQQAKFTPTKLGVVMPDLERNWHERSGWAVEITYATRPEEPYWGIDDLASRIAAHAEKGLRVLVRVDYDPQQSIPPTNDSIALSEYLAYFSRLSGDSRLHSVYGYIVGNEYNTVDASGLYPDQPVTPEWYARVFNGYSENPNHTDNVLQTVRNENQSVRIIVGPIRPWSFDADGVIKHTTSVPWLNYMNTLVSYLDETARIKNELGIPLCAPDGFDIQAPGRPDIPEMTSFARAEEPAADLSRATWNNAQAGFRVYRDWLAIINHYPATLGLPVYIISTNTFDRDTNVPPAQNYPKGWLTTALHVINAEPQIQALCWFLDDFPHSDQWELFSLSQQTGRLVDAAEEFDALLQLP